MWSDLQSWARLCVVEKCVVGLMVVTLCCMMLRLHRRSTLWTSSCRLAVQVKPKHTHTYTVNWPLSFYYNTHRMNVSQTGRQSLGVSRVMLPTKKMRRWVLTGIKANICTAHLWRSLIYYFSASHCVSRGQLSRSRLQGQRNPQICQARQPQKLPGGQFHLQRVLWLLFCLLWINIFLSLCMFEFFPINIMLGIERWTLIFMLNFIF